MKMNEKEKLKNEASKVNLMLSLGLSILGMFFIGAGIPLYEIAQSPYALISGLCFAIGGIIAIVFGTAGIIESL